MLKTRNNYDALRLVAALVVLVFHAWQIAGWGASPKFAGWHLYTLAVFVFFAVSGQLITRSWNRDARLVRFAVKRAARILPALVAVVLVTAFLLGPLLTTLTPDKYFRSGETWTYLANMVFVAQYALPGVFDTNPTSAVNGSLWSLGPEVVCYGLVVVCGVRWLSRLRHGHLIVTLLLVVSFSAAAMVVSAINGPGWLRITLVAVAVFFVASTAEILNLRCGHVLALAFVVVLAGGSLLNLPGIDALIVPLLPYLVRYVGEQSTPGVRDVAVRGDFSYGIYLWGFPLTQICVLLFPNAPLLILGVSVMSTMLLAVLSWHVIERPAQVWARRLISRGSPAASDGDARGRHR